MFKKKLETAFVSTIDKALATFNLKRPRTAAQQAEIDKYKRIHQLRDDATPMRKTKDLWTED